MQKNVNAENLKNNLVANFGKDKVNVLPGGDCKLMVKELGSYDLLNLSNMLLFANVLIKRSGPGITVIFTVKE